MDLVDELLQQGYTYYKRDNTRYLTKPTNINRTHFFIKPRGNSSVSEAQIHKHDHRFIDPFIEPKGEMLTTLKEVETFYLWAVKKAEQEVEKSLQIS